jgi:hypothetical protein
MAEITQTGQDRRSYARTSVALSQGLEVGLYGFDESGQRIDAVGVAVNLSRGGLLARTDVQLSSEWPCLGHFRGAGDRIIPRYAPGKVIRLGADEDQFLVALEFSSPLAIVNLPESVRRS